MSSSTSSVIAKASLVCLQFFALSGGAKLSSSSFCRVGFLACFSATERPAFRRSSAVSASVAESDQTKPLFLYATYPIRRVRVSAFSRTGAQRSPCTPDLGAPQLGLHAYGLEEARGNARVRGPVEDDGLVHLKQPWGGEPGRDLVERGHYAGADARTVTVEAGLPAMKGRRDFYLLVSSSTGSARGRSIFGACSSTWWTGRSGASRRLRAVRPLCLRLATPGPEEAP
jgi:hypothetical protein